MNHNQLLRWSLLGSLGLVPIACSGSSDAPEPESQAGTGNEAGMPAASGSTGTPSAGEGGSAGSETVVAGAGGRSNKLPSCTSPSTDPLTGLTQCAEGYSYRGEIVACAPNEAELGGAGGVGGAGGAAGQGDGDLFPEPVCSPACTAPNSFCAKLSGLTPSTGCLTRCGSDSDCADSELCLCGAFGNVCVAADCRSDADCDEGYHCAQEPNCDFNALGKFTCQKAADECFSSQDCNGSMCESVFAGTDHRKCAQFACGRPFLVASAPRMAPIVMRSDWLVETKQGAA